jgi:DNA-binding NarL/FixJ family response regulator
MITSVARKASDSRPRILVADDHVLVAEFCKRLLDTEFNVVGIVSNGRELIQTAVSQQPDVIVLDIAMPVLNGIDAGQQVKEFLPSVKLLYLTANSDPQVAAEVLERGAAGYLLKTCACAELLVAVRDVLRGKTYISKTIPRDTLDSWRWQHKKLVDEGDKLTDRQREVLQLLAEGKVMKEIGDILNMSCRTVAFHKYRIMDILGAKSNADLVRYAVRRHMVA